MVTAMFSQAAAATNHVARLSSADFCEKILGLPGTGIGVLQEHGYLSSDDGLVYSFNQSFPADGASLQQESESLARLVEYLPGKVHAIGAFGPMIGVPAVDAIFYPASGSPVNVSVKLSKGDSPNAMNKILSNVHGAISAVNKYYSAEYLAKLFGLEIVGDDVVAPKGLNNKRYRLGMARALSKMLGLHFDGRPSREVMIFLDRSQQTHQLPRLHTGPDNSTVLLRVEDERVREDEIRNPLELNVTHLQRELSENPALHSVVILFHDRMLIIDSQRIRMLYHTSYLK